MIEIHPHLSEKNRERVIAFIRECAPSIPSCDSYQCVSFRVPVEGEEYLDENGRIRCVEKDLFLRRSLAEWS